MMDGEYKGDGWSMLIIQLQGKVENDAGKKYIKLLCKMIPISEAEVENTK